ncbi:siderophore ferric iron reductase [Marinomonas sp. A79]|uniref:Siderophore ferric iron reductase n=1 Tax=Marinomonas vulgaris TaxID=2823372 RepID=A0ABS5H8V0_9GAMM|nr:siderophore ferric iron reductase [Marinomonas vulgaris]MBR7888126.1 siderophore ferric iron reductase [Marinomonas vulgaris]
MERSLDSLFHSSKACIPILEGRELGTDLHQNERLLSIHSTAGFLAKMHHELRKAHPEAGAPYWRVRSWGLSCWQPIYLALICVYHLKQVPNTLSHLHQSQQGAYIAGYALPDRTLEQKKSIWFTGNHLSLIVHAATQLKGLFDVLKSEHLKQFGGNNVLYQALLADQFMTSLLVAQKIALEHFHERPTILENKHTIIEEFTLWANALDLPLTPRERLHHDDTALTFTRRTCCLHFRRHDGGLCAECPRLKKNKANKDQDVQAH